MNRFLKNNKIGVYIFLTALILRTALFFINFSHNDYNLIATIRGEDGYYEISNNILLGNGFSLDTKPPYLPNSLRPLVWPSIIAFAVNVGGYPLAVILEILMGSLIPILAMQIAEFIIGERAKYVGWITAFLPYSILLSFIFYSETPFTFFFLTSILLLFKYIERQTLRYIIWSGVFLGLAILIKPTVEYFPILVPLGLLLIFKSKLSLKIIKEISLYAIVSVLILAPWFYRNYQEFGAWGLTAQPTFNLYVYVVPSLLALDNNTSFSTEVGKIVNKPDFNLDTINLSNEGSYKTQALSIISEHKLALVKSVGITIVTFFTHDGMLTVFKYSGITFKNIVSKPAIFLIAHPFELMNIISHYAWSPAILILLMRLAWILTSTLLFIGAYLYIRKNGLTAHITALLLIVVYFALTTSINGLGVNARFRVPVEPLIICVAIYGYFGIKRRISSSL